MGLTLITAPTTPLIGMDEAKEYMRVDHTTDDADIDRLCKSAEQWMERNTGRALLTQTREVSMAAWPAPSGIIKIPKPRLLSIVSVKYDQGSDGTEATVDSSDYQVDLNPDGFGRLAPAFGANWPSARLQFSAIRVRFTCGYGPGVGDVPEDLKTAVLRIISETYENRENSITGTIITEIPLSAIDMAREHRAWGP